MIVLHSNDDNDGKQRFILTVQPAIIAPREKESAETYKNPAEKEAITPTFFLHETFSFQIEGIGRTNIAKSDMTLKIPEDLKFARVSKQ